ncbi:phosphatases II [Macrolepiota fuliginosa MF-IS2]|uniref:Phosphatases II n=1 Tax=Macrolepiota fuliginosa MF-IS2 TaxID=1400762 RepID=A0A9P5XDL3_9AGAR|nr:phosphatases II [Macrolepiota fuliginosa MF-IS2]
MDAIRVPKVERVGITKAGATSTGTVHLTAHHLIFHYDDQKLEEFWVPYPLISLVNRLPQTLNGQSPLSFQTRTFEAFTLFFEKDNDASDVFESVKELTVSPSVTQLYAFFYRPNPPLPTNNGWSIYSPREEFGRMGLGSRTKTWRFSDVNKDYTFCPTYPARLVVPSRISDTTLQYASKYRSKCRIPVLTYLHWANHGSLTRSSQPMVGLTQNRSIQDEKLIEAIFQTHVSREASASSSPVYGATTTNLIIDARPTTNAVANTAKGAGTENMDHYKDAKKTYLGIDHIHAMRESLAKVVEALREADAMLASISNDLSSQVSGISVLDRSALRRSGWLRHLQAIMEGTVLITRNVHVNSSHVLIHCSDGWDRTSQLSSLSQLCLDPFYRTIRGFEILIEKDWLSYGHKFLDRCGHLSSEKFFVSPMENVGSGSGADAAQAFLASVQNRFVSQSHIKETSPVFHQFLECVRQLQRQFPTRFEFNERFLRQLYYHLYSCQFGTFLFNNEKERRVGNGHGPPPCDRTISAWDFFNSPTEMEKNKNLEYDPSLDDSTSRAPGADMGVLFPNSKDIRFWNELYGRTDEEMNGRIIAAAPRSLEFVNSIENAEHDPGLPRTGTPSNVSLPPSPNLLPAHTTVLPSRSLSVNSDPARSTTPLSISGTSKESSASLHEPSSGAGAYSLSPPPSLTSMVPDWFSSSQSSAQRGRAKPPDFLGGAGTGVKSVWGKLSLNASAAFSAVQGAYAGVAKDLGKAADGNEETSARTAEMSGRDTLSAWGEEPTASSTSHVTSSLSSLSVNTNPWALGQPNTTSSWEENPWSSAPASNQALPTRSVDPSSSLPLDPTVATPLRRTTMPATTRVERTVQQIKDPPQSPGGSDPLGVGPL